MAFDRSIWWLAIILVVVASGLNAYSYLDHSVEFTAIVFVARIIITFALASIVFVLLFFVRRLSGKPGSLMALNAFYISWAVLSLLLLIPGVTRPAPIGLLYLFNS